MTTEAEQTEVLALLRQTLEEYLAAVPKQQEPNPPDLLAIFARLDELNRKLNPAYPAQLRHYMFQKSYRKAYLFLQGRDEENTAGNCDR